MTDAFVRRVHGELARTNREVLSGNWSTLDFAQFWCSDLAHPAVEDGPRPDWVHAEGMVRSSLERHLLISDGKSTAARQLMTPDAVVVALAGDHPPRDVLRPYLDGTGFLENDGEQAFKVATEAVGSLFGQAIEALQPLTTPSAWDNPESVERLQEAGVYFGSANAHFRNLARADDETRRQFTDEVRGFFQSRKVGGSQLEGINAAHEWRAASMDSLLGVGNKAHRKYLNVIRQHFTAGDRDAFDRVLALRSLRRSLAARLGVTNVLDGQARNAVIRQGPQIRAAADAFTALLDTFAGVSGAHGGVIRTYLERASGGPSSLQRGIPVSFGSGGRPHAETIAIHTRRREIARLARVHLSFPTERTELSWPPTTPPVQHPGRASSAPDPSV